MISLVVKIYELYSNGSAITEVVIVIVIERIRKDFFKNTCFPPQAGFYFPLPLFPKTNTPTPNINKDVGSGIVLRVMLSY